MAHVSARWITSFALIASLITGCAASAMMNDDDRLDGTAWILSELPGRTLLPDSPATLRFAEGRAGGTDGCNRLSRPYTATGSKLEFGAPGISTQMACPPEISEQAKTFRASLDAARSFRLDSERLELIGADGVVLASFKAQPVGLAGTNWRVTGYNNGRQAVVSALTGTTLTMQFATDGRVSGSAGCNNYMGSYRHEGDSLEFGTLATSRRMCAQPEGIMEQERQFLQALETVTTMQREGERLEMRGERGELVASLTAMPAS